ncbi:MAG: Planktothrix phage PaV-LD [Cyanobacteriota bacterium]
MFNRKLEDRVSDVEEQLDDAFFWIFITCLLLGFGILKFNQSSSQVSRPQSTTTSETITLGKDAPKFIYPHSTPYPISSGFGMREHPVTRDWKQHNGIDFAAPGGANILAVADGQVSFAGDMGGCGNAVEIEHSGGYLSKYCHASKVLVQILPRLESFSSKGSISQSRYTYCIGWHDGNINRKSPALRNKTQRSVY